MFVKMHLFCKRRLTLLTYFVRALGGTILVNFVYRETLLRSSMAGQMWNPVQGALHWCLVRPLLKTVSKFDGYSRFLNRCICRIQSQVKTFELPM